ncbi:hypothetical protein J6590_070478 [Homalodisca vitripennis]|nr:hypothetical protein J6590_070478 [Homalodisca vitripennis]
MSPRSAQHVSLPLPPFFLQSISGKQKVYAPVCQSQCSNHTTHHLPSETSLGTRAETPPTFEGRRQRSSLQKQAENAM